MFLRKKLAQIEFTNIDNNKVKAINFFNRYY